MPSSLVSRKVTARSNSACFWSTFASQPRSSPRPRAVRPPSLALAVLHRSAEFATMAWIFRVNNVDEALASNRDLTNQVARGRMDGICGLIRGATRFDYADHG